MSWTVSSLWWLPRATRCTRLLDEQAHLGAGYGQECRPTRTIDLYGGLQPLSRPRHSLTISNVGPGLVDASEPRWTGRNRQSVCLSVQTIKCELAGLAHSKREVPQNGGEINGR